MKLVRWNPYRSVPTFNTEWDALFDRVFSLQPTRFFGEDSWTPRANVEETDDGYRIHAEAPGFKKDEIKVSYDDGVLTLSGERKAEEKNDTGAIWLQSRFSRSFRLPNHVEGKNITAQLEDGVLTIEAPKAEDAKVKLIEIR